MEDVPQSSHMALTSSAMVELKAELSRKKEEFRREKASNANLVKGKRLQKVQLKKKLDVWNQKNAGVSARAQKDVEEAGPDADEDVLLKSKLILERKCKIYDAISSSGDIPEEDGSEGYLVDFQKKAVDGLVEERERRRKDEQEKEEEGAEREALAEPIPEADNSDEEWIDYTDSLGRSKRCMRKDLKDLQKQDQDFSASVNKRKSKPKDNMGDEDNLVTDSEHLMSNDMYREKMRKKWEEEARQLIEKGQEEIHYANVQFDEIRTHGVGFYQFSKDQEERDSQMQKLSQLRHETKTERSRTEMVKDKRKALMEARLAKVRERRKLKTKETPGAEVDADSSPIPSEEDIEEKRKAEEKKREKEEVERVAEEKRNKFIRDWDKKKIASSWKGDGYVESRRQERESEFAPPSIYYNDAHPPLKSSSSTNAYGKKKFPYSTNKPSAQSILKINNDIVDVNKKFFCDASSDLKVKDTAHSDAGSATRSSKVSGSSQSSSSCVKTLHLHSIPLPSDVKITSNYKSCDIPPELPSCNMNDSDSALPSDKHNHSNLPCQHVNNPTPNLQCQHPNIPDPNLQCQSLTWNQNTTQYPSSMNQHLSWSQQQQQPIVWSEQQRIFWQQQQQQQQGLQHQYLSNQMAQPSVAEGASHQHFHQSKVFAQTQQVDTSGVKRSSETDIQTSSVNTPKKLKVPKSAILDNRFVLNSEAAQPSGSGVNANETGSLVTVEAVPYKPGSFTDAKFKNEAPKFEDESSLSSRGKSQISGGPMLYTEEQRRQQLKEIREGEESDKEVDGKVEEFLQSVKNEIK